MTGIDIEVGRAALVIGIVLAAFIYQYWGIVSGGAVTGSYIALMIIGGNWFDIVAWFVLSLVGVLAIRFASQTWPLPRAWLFAIGVFFPALIHSTLEYVVGLSLFGEWSALLVAGLYVTNGLTAYDMQRQGIPKTLFGVAIVASLVYFILIPVAWGMDLVRQGEPLLSEPSLRDPVLVVVCVAVALAVRVSLRLGTAGIIGALFFLEMASLAAAIVVVAMALVGTFIYRLVERSLGLTPRQRLYSMLAVGAIAGWFGLFWAEWLGIPGAEQAHQFGVEPLLVIGLMMGEMVRFGIPRMLTGSLVVLAVTALAAYLVAAYPSVDLLVALAAVVLAGALSVVGYVRANKEWSAAFAEGTKFSSVTHRGSPRAAKRAK